MWASLAGAATLLRRGAGRGSVWEKQSTVKNHPVPARGGAGRGG